MLVNLQAVAGAASNGKFYQLPPDKENTGLSLCVSLCHCSHYSILVIGNDKGGPQIPLIQVHVFLMLRREEHYYSWPSC